MTRAASRWGLIPVAVAALALGLSACSNGPSVSAELSARLPDADQLSFDDLRISPKAAMKEYSFPGGVMADRPGEVGQRSYSFRVTGLPRIAEDLTVEMFLYDLGDSEGAREFWGDHPTQDARRHSATGFDIHTDEEIADLIDEWTVDVAALDTPLEWEQVCISGGSDTCSGFAGWTWFCGYALEVVTSHTPVWEMDAFEPALIIDAVGRTVAQELGCELEQS